MKYALVFGFLLVVFWLWRSSRPSVGRTQKPDTKKQNTAAQTTKLTIATEIVACRQCGLHLPLADALEGKTGLYCSPAHKQLAGD